jgi:hypothetical protein
LPKCHWPTYPSPAGWAIYALGLVGDEKAPELAAGFANPSGYRDWWTKHGAANRPK